MINYRHCKCNNTYYLCMNASRARSFVPTICRYHFNCVLNYICLASLLLILQERLLQLFWEQKNEVWMLFDMDLWGKCIDLKLYCYCFNDKHERFKYAVVQVGESGVTCCLLVTKFWFWDAMMKFDIAAKCINVE